MTVYISRDYSPAATGYATNKAYMHFPYQLTTFLTKVLGYTVVGQTAWNLDNNDIKANLTITAATNTTPIQITTSSAHGLSDGYVVLITGGTGNPNMNGTWIVSVINSTNFTLYGSSGNGAYTGGGLMSTGYLYASGLASDGYGTSINSGVGTYVLSIPTAKRVVQATDNLKMIVLKSRLYPTKNSGCFKISAVDTVNNRYTIDYRSTDTPPSETGTIDWWLYEIETTASNYIIQPAGAFSLGLITVATNTSPIVITTSSTQTGIVTGQKVLITGGAGNTAVNGTWTVTMINATQLSLNGSTGNGTYTPNSASLNLAGYGSDGPAPNSRIILQSPHPSGWQVKFAMESTSSNYPLVSVALGYGGNSAGDFPVGGTVTSSHQFLDVNPLITTVYSNTVVGGGNAATPSRTTIVGDDGGQAILVYTRPAAGNTGLTTFGICDNEPTPLFPNSDRIFCYGSSINGDFGVVAFRVISAQIVGNTFRGSVPEYCAVAGWCNLDGTSLTSPMKSANAGDSPFTSSTEIVPWEVWGGTYNDSALNVAGSSSPTIFSLDQRFMGTAPFVRNGRDNFGNYTLSTDSTAAFTVSTTTGNAVSPIQITTSAVNALTTGQTVVISGVTGNTAANGTFVITVIDNQHFTLNGTTGNGTYAGGGTGNGCPRYIHLERGIYLMWNGAAGLTP